MQATLFDVTCDGSIIQKFPWTTKLPEAVEVIMLAVVLGDWAFKHLEPAETDH